MVKNMLEIIVATLWGTCAVYTIWYSTSAKHYAPITLTEAKLLWKIHRQSFNCNSRKWRKIKYRGEIVGFECECGHKHIQRKPIVGSPPSSYNAKPQNSPTLIIERLHTSYK